MQWGPRFERETITDPEPKEAPMYGAGGDVEREKAALIATLNDVQVDPSHPAASVYRRNGTDLKLALKYQFRDDWDITPPALRGFTDDSIKDSRVFRPLLEKVLGTQTQRKGIMDMLKPKKGGQE